MKALIVEDDFASGMLLKKLLEPWFKCDTAEDGQEAADAFRKALDENAPYDLICLDIMMPGMDGHACLRAIRDMENNQGVFQPNGAKIIMTSASGDSTNVANAFENQCEAYLVKPIEKERLLEQVRALGLIGAE